MRQTRTRILSLLLALVMCLGLLPVTALAAGGSSGEPTLFLDPNQTSSLSESSTGGFWTTPPPPDTVIGEVIFHMNGAGADQMVNVKLADKKVDPPQDPTLPGYRFLGWYSNARFTDETYGATGSRGYNVNRGSSWVLSKNCFAVLPRGNSVRSL